MTKEFQFLTPFCTTRSVMLSEDCTVADARLALAPLLHSPPEDLHIFFCGRKLDDSERVTATGRDRRPPVVYRHIPIGQVASDPPDFDEQLANLMFVVIDRFDRETVGDILRSADYDAVEAVERLVVMAEEQATDAAAPPPPPSADVPANVWRQLEQVKPASLAMEAAVDLYRDVCAGNLEMAIAMLRAMPQSRE
jgi:hypothetical protein